MDGTWRIAIAMRETKMSVVWAVMFPWPGRSNAKGLVVRSSADGNDWGSFDVTGLHS